MRVFDVIGRRVRTLRAITRQSGYRNASRLLRTFLVHQFERGSAIARHPLRVTREMAGSGSADTATRAQAIAIDPSAVFQPDPAAIDGHAHVDFGDTANITTRSDSKIYYKDIPYSKYLNEWHFHPGRIGGDLAKTAIGNAQLPRIASKLPDLFTRLPNGGVALYYPKTFGVTRLRATEYLYSGIAQAQLLAGYSRLARHSHFSAEQRTAWNSIAHELAQSLTFPFDRGGVCMEGKVLLEAPNFRSPPEIILNGWMDALIRLYDYVATLEHKEDWQEFLHENIRALAQLLPHFDDEELRLSRYSNASPYRMTLRFGHRIGPAPPRIELDYTATCDGFRGYRIGNLWGAEGLADCAFENKIAACGSRHMDVVVTSSSLYDLELTVAGDALRLETDSAAYGIWSESPRIFGRTIVFDPVARANGTTVFRIPAGKFLMAGQATDFGKGKNFYHTYHVVALLELARLTHDRAARSVLREFALKWLDYITAPKARASDGALPFAEPARVHRQLTHGRGQDIEADFGALLESVRERVSA